MPKPPKPHNKVDPRSLANLRPFAPGTSGNTKGSPNGSRHKVSIMLEAVLDGQSEALVQKVIAMALDGNEMALKACIDRLIPIRRGRTVRFQLPPITDPTTQPRPPQCSWPR
jgi:hypothetical protein